MRKRGSPSCLQRMTPINNALTKSVMLWRSELAGTRQQERQGFMAGKKTWDTVNLHLQAESRFVCCRTWITVALIWGLSCSELGEKAKPTRGLGSNARTWQLVLAPTNHSLKYTRAPWMIPVDSRTGAQKALDELWILFVCFCARKSGNAQRMMGTFQKHTDACLKWLHWLYLGQLTSKTKRNSTEL